MARSSAKKSPKTQPLASQDVKRIKRLRATLSKLESKAESLLQGTYEASLSEIVAALNLCVRGEMLFIKAIPPAVSGDVADASFAAPAEDVPPLTALKLVGSA